MAGCVVGRFGPVPESIPPFDRGSRPGLARCPQALFRGEEAGNEPLRLVQLKVPAKSVQAEVLSREEIKSVLHDLPPSHPGLLNRCKQLNLLRKDFIVRQDVSDLFLQTSPLTDFREPH